MEAQCVVGKLKPREETGLTSPYKLLEFSHILEILVTAKEEMLQNS